jgi:hypothetical protein
MWFPEVIINLAILCVLLDIAVKIFNGGIIIWSIIRLRYLNDR